MAEVRSANKACYEIAGNENVRRAESEPFSESKVARLESAAENYAKAGIENKAYECLENIEKILRFMPSPTGAEDLHGTKAEYLEKTKEKIARVIEEAKANEKEIESLYNPKLGTERLVAPTIGIAGLASGMLFISSNLTGFAVSILSKESINLIGVSLLTMGFMGLYFYLRRKTIS